VAHNYLRFVEFDGMDPMAINPTLRLLAAMYPIVWCAIIVYVVFMTAYPQWICYPVMRKAEDRYVTPWPAS